MTITFLNEKRNSRGNEIYCFSLAQRKVILVFASLNSNSETADSTPIWEIFLFLWEPPLLLWNEIYILFQQGEIMKMKSASFYIFYILFQQGQIMKRNHTTIMKRITSHHDEAVLQFWGACDICGHHPWAKLWSDFIQLPACHLNPVLHLHLPVNGQRLDDQEVNHSKHMSCLLKNACVLKPVG